MEPSNYNLEKVFKELDMHCRINGRYGFTIPYLIKLSTESLDTFSIKYFLSELSNNSQVYFITLCGDLEEIIIGLHKPSEYAPIHMYPHFGSLYYDDDKLGKFADFQTLSDHLTKLYQPRISEGTFSKNPDTLKWE